MEIWNCKLNKPFPPLSWFWSKCFIKATKRELGHWPHSDFKHVISPSSSVGKAFFHSQLGSRWGHSQSYACLRGYPRPSPHLWWHLPRMGTGAFRKLPQAAFEWSVQVCKQAAVTASALHLSPESQSCICSSSAQSASSPASVSPALSVQGEVPHPIRESQTEEFVIPSVQDC